MSGKAKETEAEHAPKEERHEEAHKGGHESHKSGPGILSSALSRTWSAVTGITNGIWKRTKRAVGGAWQGTGGAVVEGTKELAKSTGLESKEPGVLHKVAGVMQSVRERILGKGLMGGVLGFPSVMIEEFLRGVENIVYGAVTGEKLEKGHGSAAARHTEEKAAHEAGAHGAH